MRTQQEKSNNLWSSSETIDTRKSTGPARESDYVFSVFLPYDRERGVILVPLLGVYVSAGGVVLKHGGCRAMAAKPSRKPGRRSNHGIAVEEVRNEQESLKGKAQRGALLHEHALKEKVIQSDRSSLVLTTPTIAKWKKNAEKTPGHHAPSRFKAL